MEIRTKTSGNTVEVALSGRLDTNTAPALTEALNQAVTDEVEAVIFDFAELSYISSAGLRVILQMQKKMNARQGSMTVRHPNDIIWEVFEATGFTEIMQIER